jgi:hypothetical protein
MAVNLSFGWWIAPAAITAAAYAWHRWIHWEETSSGDYGNIGAAIGRALTFMVALSASLVAWLLWAVFA